LWGTGPSPFRFAVALGVWIASVTEGKAMFAGKDQEVLVIWVQDEGMIAAVAPDGNPVTVKLTGTGKMVPAVGTILSGYVAVPPGGAVCVLALPPLPLPDPLPLPPPEPFVRLKSARRKQCSTARLQFEVTPSRLVADGGYGSAEIRPWISCKVTDPNI